MVHLQLSRRKFHRLQSGGLEESDSVLDSGDVSWEVQHDRQPDGVGDRPQLSHEGYFARLMYRSLYKMHEAALHGRGRTLLGLVAPGARPAPTVKLN
jgi:hypothetical protein